MERIYSAELSAHVGERVRIAGWVHRVRRLSRVTFLIVRDARGLSQVVLADAALVAQVEGLYAESVVAVEGVATANTQAPAGVEICEPSLDVISASVAPPPMDLFRPTLDSSLPSMLDHAALTLRHQRRRALWQIAAASLAGFRRSLTARAFVEIATPKIVGAATEGGANVFPVDYFGRPAYLAQSPQFYKQIMAGVFERVFETGPVFRAEPHDTARHLNEYTSLDAEMAFFYDVTGNIAIDLVDTLLILAHFGHGPTRDQLDNVLNRAVADLGATWRTSADNDGIDLEDVLASLESFGHRCA